MLTTLVISCCLVFIFLQLTNPYISLAKNAIKHTTTETYLITLFYFPNKLYASIRNTKILQTIPPQNRYNFKPSYLKKLFLLSSSSRIFCFITLVSVSDCFSRSFVALCIASIFACNAFLTSWTVFSLTSSFKLPTSSDIAS